VIDKLTPQARINIAKAKVVAMKFGVEEGVSLLHGVEADGNPLDVVAAGLAESELYYLDCNFDAALRVFTSRVDPLLDRIDERVASIIADNKSRIQMASLRFPAPEEFEHLVDQRRILGVEMHDYAGLLEAADWAAKGKHFNALPIYWQQVLRTHRLQNWRAIAMAEKEFSRECLSLGSWEDAAYHAMMCLQQETIEAVGKGLLGSKSVENIRRALARVLKLSSLAGHAVQVMGLIEATSDGIPDDLLDEVTKWLMKHAEPKGNAPFFSPMFESLWSAIASIANRLDAKHAKTFVDCACQNVASQGNNIHRQHAIKALISLCPKLSSDGLANLKNAVLPLVGERKNDFDYVDAMNLLIYIAHYGGDNLRDSIRQQIVPPGTEIRDAVLLHAANVFGWTPQNPESFSYGARTCAAVIGKQIQRLAPGEEPANIGAIYTVTHGLPQDQRIAVHLAGGIPHLEALTSYRKIIEETALRDLLAAILAMISEDDNLIGNRVNLIRVLSRYFDVIPGGLEQEIVNTLEPLAAGQITETDIGQTYAQVNNPLNPYKTGSCNPVELRGAALAALGVMEKYQPNIKTQLHDGLLVQALTSADPELRRLGLIAVEKCATLSRDEAILIALATLDPDDVVAASGMRALYNAGTRLELDATAEQIVVRALESAIGSQSVKRRRNAAALLSVIQIQRLTPETRIRMERIADEYRRDICYSVRSIWDQRPA
jgi:hypothetical protein